MSRLQINVVNDFSHISLLFQEVVLYLIKELQQAAQNRFDSILIAS